MTLVREIAGLYAMWIAAVPVVFFILWRWFDFFRRRPALLYALIAATLATTLAVTIAFRDPLFSPAFRPPLALQVAGWAIFCGASIFATVADRQIGWYVRLFRPFFDPRARIKLRTTGAYGVVRHPIYAAAGMLQIGLFLATGYWAVLAAWAFYIGGAMRFTRREEERVMELLDDPSEYERYRERVPALFPSPARRGVRT